MMRIRGIATLTVRTRPTWRRWLRSHHSTSSGVFLVFFKRHTGCSSPSYEETVEEALCFGWIDSLVKRIDDDRYARLFTPRKPGSAWSTINRRRYADLKQRGLLAAAGKARSPTTRSGDPPRPSRVPVYITRALSENRQAHRFFRDLAPSYRRGYVGWIDSAKREETRQRRLRRAIEWLAAGKKQPMP